MAEQCARARRFGDAKARVLLNAVLPGRRPEEISPGRMRDELRRPRLRGLMERLPRTHRHRLIGEGLRTALVHARVCSRRLRPAVASLIPSPLSDLPAKLRCVQAAEMTVNSRSGEVHIAAQKT